LLYHFDAFGGKGYVEDPPLAENTLGKGITFCDTKAATSAGVN
jgi:hypothetical protein